MGAMRPSKSGGGGEGREGRGKGGGQYVVSLSAEWGRGAKGGRDRQRKTAISLTTKAERLTLPRYCRGHTEVVVLSHIAFGGTCKLRYS